MHSNLIKTGLALSLAASIVFSQAAPVVAGGKYDFNYDKSNWSHQHDAGNKSWTSFSGDKLSSFLDELTSKYSKEHKQSPSNKKNYDKPKKEAPKYAKPDSSDKKKRDYLDKLKDKYDHKDKYDFKDKYESIKDKHAPKKVKPSPSPKKDKAKDYKFDYSKHISKKQYKKEGTIKVYDYKDCKLIVKTHDFDSRVKKLNYSFAIYGTFGSHKHSDFSGKITINNSKTSTIDMSKLIAKYRPNHKHGLQFKLTFTKDGLKDKYLSKKIVWVKDCKVAKVEEDKSEDKDTNKPAVVNQDTNKPTKDNGKALSTSTKQTEVKGASIERNDDNLPATGGIGVAAAQAAGLSLITFGGVAMHIRRLRSKIDEQMNV